LNRTGLVTSGIFGRSAPAAASAVVSRRGQNHVMSASSPREKRLKLLVRGILPHAAACRTCRRQDQLAYPDSFCSVENLGSWRGAARLRWGSSGGRAARRHEQKPL